MERIFLLKCGRVMITRGRYHGVLASQHELLDTRHFR